MPEKPKTVIVYGLTFYVKPASGCLLVYRRDEIIGQLRRRWDSGFSFIRSPQRGSRWRVAKTIREAVRELWKEIQGKRREDE